MSYEDHSQVIARVKTSGPINTRDFSGALVGTTGVQHGMARYDFVNGHAVDFLCFCGQTFHDASQLSAHIFNTEKDVTWQPVEYKGRIVGYIPSDDEDAYIRKRIRDAGRLARKVKPSAHLTAAEISDVIAAARNEPDENGRLD